MTSLSKSSNVPFVTGFAAEQTHLKEESEKASLKLNINKTKIMVVSPIPSRQIEWDKEETVTGFLFLCSKTTAHGDCSHEMKRSLLLGRKAMTNLGSIF